MARPMHLDETDITKYFHLKRLNLSDKVIAEQHFMVSFASLNRWKKKYNINPRHTPEEYYHLKSLGHSEKEISVIWGMTKSGLYLWKRRNNLSEEWFTYMNKKGRKMTV